MDNQDSSTNNRLKRKQMMLQKRRVVGRSISPSKASSSNTFNQSNCKLLEPTQQHPQTIPLRSEESTNNTHLLLNFGFPEYTCNFCGAIFWFAERLKSYGSQNPIFSQCCRVGRIKLPKPREIPSPLKELMDYRGSSSSKLFRDNLRTYNSIFAFTSMGAKIDRDINKHPGPYVFKINGQNHHLIGSLLPMEGKTPNFAQLYIYDTDNEVANRMSTFTNTGSPKKIDEAVVAQLIAMFDRVNELVKVFRMARDRFTSGETHSLSLTLCGKRIGDGSQYNTPTASEMAGLIVGDLGQASQARDIIVEYQTKMLKQIDDLHPSFMAMQYPILFPYGEDGFRLKIPYQKQPNQPELKRGTVTRREYYAYMLQQRKNSPQLLISGGRLFQQYIVDAFTCIEDERLRYIRFKHQQEHHRCELYKGVQDAFLRGDVASSSIGQRVILPSSFTGGPRYMIQNYHDAMAICRTRGNPDLFITFTCNVNWIEIQNALSLIPGQKAQDRPDIVSRVFNMKLTEFMNDIRKNNYFGRVVAAIYTVEFQKRGLPHVHIIVWLNQQDKCPTVNDINKIISAEIPDKETDQELYNVVSKFMIHGPCGEANSQAPCIKEGKCMKHFPKKYSPETIIAEDGFIVYKRRDDDKVVVKVGVELDNRFVVPYNRGLLLKYQAHINVEWCNRSRSIKYLFKYVNKGPDRTRAVLRDSQEPNSEIVDEIRNYVDCRYLTAYESSWRIFEYHIHYKFPTVERLTIHMPLMNNIVFPGDKEIEELLNQPGIEKTMLTEWMFTNFMFEDARGLTYTEFPTYWRWDGAKKLWFRRKQGQCIGRISYIHPASGDLYYLRMLLSQVKGALNFTDIRTVKGVVHQTFKEACNAMGLIGDDREWHDAMDEASQWATSKELRQLFVTLIIFCEVTNVNHLFQTQLSNLRDDIIYKAQQRLGMSDINLTEEQTRNQVLIELQILFQRNGTCLTDFKLPTPTGGQVDDYNNTLLREEMSYNTIELQDQNHSLAQQLNDEQKIVYEAILTSVYQHSGGLFFVYGHGGTGKTFLYNAIISRLRSEGKIVLAVASSGIASLLLPGGRTAHSRFKIPIDVHEQSCCHIKKGTQLAQLLQITSLIVWDEAPMAHRNCFEALDRSLNDILSQNEDVHLDTALTFGGKTVLLGGDFRQILPVVVKGSRHDTIQSCIAKSALWNHCKIFQLKTNMRLSIIGLTEEEKSQMNNFARWLLDIGEGKVEAKRLNDEEEYASWIKIPDSMLILSEKGDVEDITSEIYDKLDMFYKEAKYLKERAILTATNEAVDVINTKVLSLIPSEEKNYLSFDSISKEAGASSEDDILYPTEFLNSLSFPGVPNHQLSLKINTPVMLLRNINQSMGLCNGTRLMIKRLGDRIIEAVIMTGSNIGDKVYIPRIIMSATDKKWPFTLKRRQFPIRLCYAMTINKSQGQTLEKVGLYLPRPVFSHGQLYVAASRVTTYKGLKVMLGSTNEDNNGYTKNIVYHEIFHEL
ncbi:uncharacterized protein LOC120009516 [Tripterygium wilfordii]|uniref:uncharacterized protein LOC120009516 n=1 Tax=Tripterygium wilfordii TaxID=458696 RepID=UPI0018F85ACB|nr:uncharacterized protein LOC120009516 [Tripterygium wilfordii]